jgi:3-isopropylmalate/(R)-2-methylmalate dehydratase small subunit
VAALQRAIAATPAVPFTLDVEALQVGFQAQDAPGALAEAPRLFSLQLAEGPHRMLVSGQWDGTSQLVAHDSALRATAARLPYLVGFSS